MRRWLSVLLVPAVAVSALAAQRFSLNRPVQKCGVQIESAVPTDDGVQRTVAEAEKILAGEGLYSSGRMEKPDFVFLSNGRVATYAIVSLPEGWEEQAESERKAVVTLHGHCGNAAMNHALWHELAGERGMAVISLQWWVDSNLPPPGFQVFREGGRARGYHLDCRLDLFPFVDALVDRVEASSVMVHGVSMAAANCVALVYRDKLKQNRVDLGIFNAGHIAGNHPFRREIRHAARAACGAAPLAGERFIFFYDNPVRKETAHEFVEEYGGEILEVVTGDGHHGVFFSPRQAGLRKRIIDTYEAVANEALALRH